MTSNNHILEAEHQRLAQAWLEAERARVDILQGLLKNYGDRCTMDYPDDAFTEYQQALSQASAANREYVQ